MKHRNNLTSTHRVVLLLRVALSCLVLAGCATHPQPLIDTVTDRVEFKTITTPGFLQLEAHIARGKAQGAMLGAAGGFLACVGAGLEFEGLTGMTGAGLALGILSSPFCTVLGSVAAGTEANDQSIVEKNQTFFREAMTDQLISQEFVNPLNQALLQNSILTRGSEPPKSLSIKPSHKLNIYIERLQLAGGGIDPQLPLEAIARINLTTAPDEQHLIDQKVAVQSGAYRLDEWVNGGAYLRKYELNQLAQSLEIKISQILMRISTREIPRKTQNEDTE